MRILTLTQPYASLIAIGAKKIETRSWATSYRGLIAIHAAIGLGPVGGATGLRRLCRDNDAFWQVLRGWITDINGSPMEPAEALPRGAIVAVAYLAGCPRMDVFQALQPRRFIDAAGCVWNFPLTDQERAFGDYSPGRYAWLLAEVRPLRTPLPWRGAQGLRPLPAEAVAQIEAAL